MTIIKTEHKTVLLLSPQRLQSDYLVLESLHVTTSKTGIAYKENDLTAMEIDNYYTRLPIQARNILLKFNNTEIFHSLEEIKTRYTLQKEKTSYKVYYQEAMRRRTYDLLELFKPYASLVSWYHRIQDNDSNQLTDPCRFSSFKPQLQFEVRLDKKLLHLHINISLNGALYAYDLFNRYHFLLESSNEYFLLSYKDYQTLERLQHNDPAVYGSLPTEFAHKILAPLECDYTVNRNNLIPKIEIDIIPENRVQLSEISQKFLVLTPQWTYDGFLVEGPWVDTYETNRNGDVYVIKRNREAEKAFVSTLELLHDKFSSQVNGYYYLSFTEAQKNLWFLNVYHQLLQNNIQIVGMDTLKHFRYSSHKISLQSEVITEANEELTLKVKVSFGKEEVPLAELQKLLIADQRNVLLKDGSIGIIHDEWLKQYGTVIRHGKVRGGEIQVPRWFAFSETDNAENKSILKSVLKTGWKQKWKLWQETSDTLYTVPSMISANLRPYQQKGFEWMMILAEANAGACLADDMGLGKTLQTICFLASQVAQYPGIPHLIVCPASLIYNWQQEFSKFAPGISTFVHHGASRSPELDKEKSQVIITTYGTLRSEIELISKINFAVAVLDESHNIKNPAALITKAVGKLQANIRIALSGTPIMNNTFDLFAQLNFVLPGMFGNQEFFKREYSDSIDRDHDVEKILELRKLTDPFILRRTKQQVAGDLPSKTETIMWCTMGTAQKALYDEIKAKIRASIFLNIQNDGLNKSKLQVIQGMLKLRQLCNSPLLLPVDEQSDTIDSVKTDLLMNELATNLKDHKVLVFSQFTSMLHLLAKECREKGIAYYHFDGQTPPAKRIEMVDKFQQEDDTTNVFLISLKSGNAGLNLTAADYVFLFDPWWNTAVQQQAIDRTHRIGQTKNVFAYKMVCKNTIEEKIIEIQERKKKLADDLVVEDEGFVKALSVEEIEYLFS